MSSLSQSQRMWMKWKENNQTLRLSRKVYVFHWLRIAGFATQQQQDLMSINVNMFYGSTYTEWKSLHISVVQQKQQLNATNVLNKLNKLNKRGHVWHLPKCSITKDLHEEEKKDSMNGTIWFLFGLRFLVWMLDIMQWIIYHYA